MKINGYEIREAIKRWTLERDTSSGQFNDSLYAFKDENKIPTSTIMETFQQADHSIARIEEIQQRFNQAQTCNVQGQTHTLSYCVKLLGGAGRQEKMWRSAVTKKRDRYGYREQNLERSKENEYAQRTMTEQECLQKAKAASSFAASLRNAISRANSTEIELEALGIESTEAQQLFGREV